MERLWRDLIGSIRLLIRHYRVSLAAIVTVALGIGAVTVVFSVFEAVVLRALPSSHADRLLSVAYSIPGQTDRSGFGHLALAQAKERWRCFDLVGSYTLANFATMSVKDGDTRVVASTVSTTFFDLFGAAPILGRSFAIEDGLPDRDRVVVLAYALWKRQFGGDIDIVGRSVRFNGQMHRVIGVMPPDFRMPVAWIEAWVPDVDSVSERNYAGLTHQVIARLAPGWSLDRARESLRGEGSMVTHTLINGSPVDQASFLSIAPLRDILVGPVGFAATLLLVVVAVVMLIACVNVALLLLALNAARHKEFAVRLALGATRRRLMWQSWLDSVLLSIAGGGLGAAIAFPSLRLIREFGPVGVPRLREAVADGRVFVVAIAAVTVAAILTGILPVLEVKDASITPAMGGTGDQTRNRTKIFGRMPVDTILTTVQVALVLLLVAVASLLLRSVTRLLTVNPGFTAAGLTTIQFEPVRRSEPGFSRQVIEELGRIPAVDSVAAARYLRFMPMLSGVTAEGSSNATFEVGNQIASSQFFATLGIPILEGRTFSPDLHATDPCQVVINRAFAEAAWPGRPPIGQIVNAGFSCTVVGVVGDVRFHADGTVPRYQMYFSDRSGLGDSDTFFVRLRRDDFGTRATVVAYAKSVDPTRRIAWSGRMSEVLYERVVTPPFYAVVFGWFGAIGLVLAAVGVYGMMSQVVVRRRREMGIRLAVGATRANIRSMLLRRAASMLAVGVVIGLLAAVAIGKSAGHMLYDMTPSDPIALFTAGGVVVAVGLLAAMIPSHRASRVDPTELFRTE